MPITETSRAPGSYTVRAARAGRRYARRTPGVPVVTDGAKGLYWLEHGQLRHMPAFKVDVRDTLGAGDVFQGALALAIGRGEDVAQALRFGSAAAAVKVTRFGGREGCPPGCFGRPQGGG